MRKEAEVRLALAQAAADAARGRVAKTLAEARFRLSPRALADDAIAGLNHQIDHVLDATVEGVRQRPVTTASAIVAVLLVLFRDPIIDILTHLSDARDETAEDAEALRPEQDLEEA